MFGPFFRINNNNNDNNNYDNNVNDDDNDDDRYIYIPKLVNLVVNSKARRFGLGSLLVSQCIKEANRVCNNANQIILQVEADNPSSYRFYKRLGFDDLYVDISTRYQTKGVFLETVRASKIMMRKLI